MNIHLIILCYSLLLLANLLIAVFLINVIFSKNSKIEKRILELENKMKE